MKVETTPYKMAFLYVIIVIVICFSLLYGWVPALHKQAYVGIAAMLASFVIVPRYFRTPLFFLTFFYAVVVWFNGQWGDEYAHDKILLDGLMLGVSGSMSFYLMKSDDQRVKKWISVCVMMIIIIQTIPALVIYNTSSDTIRNFMISEDTNQYNFEWEQLFRFGVFAYPMIHCIPILVPPLMMWIQSKEVNKRWRFFCLFVTICIFLLSIIYDVTTVQFLTIFCIISSLFIRPDQPKRTRQRVILVTVVLLPFIFSSTLQVGVLKGIEAVAPGQMKEKVSDMIYGIEHNDDSGDMANRKNLYSVSLKSFVKSPVIGVDSYTEIGDHSALFDRMAAFGLVGFVPYVLVFIIAYRLCKQKMPSSCRWYYIICTVYFVSLLILKNMSHLEVWVMYLVVAPSLLTMTINSKNAIRA